MKKTIGVVLPSKAKGGRVSRIVDTLAASGVVTTRADVHCVVAVADPDFRGELEAAARRRHLI